MFGRTSSSVVYCHRGWIKPVNSRVSAALFTNCGVWALAGNAAIRMARSGKPGERVHMNPSLKVDCFTYKSALSGLRHGYDQMVIGLHLLALRARAVRRVTLEGPRNP